MTNLHVKKQDIFRDLSYQNTVAYGHMRLISSPTILSSLTRDEIYAAYAQIRLGMDAGKLNHAEAPELTFIERLLMFQPKLPTSTIISEGERTYQDFKKLKTLAA